MTTQTTPALERMKEKVEAANYTDMEIIQKLSRHAMEHAKSCEGCELESLLYAACGRIVELSPFLPIHLKDDAIKAYESLWGKDHD